MQLVNSGCLNMFKYIQKSCLKYSFLKSLTSLDSLLYPTENELSGSRNSEWNIFRQPKIPSTVQPKCKLCGGKNSRFEFVDDLTTLEKINLLLIDMSSHNIRTHIPNDIISSNMVIPPQNLKSQGFLEDIQKWTKSQLMTINERRRKI